MLMKKTSNKIFVAILVFVTLLILAGIAWLRFAIQNFLQFSNAFLHQSLLNDDVISLVLGSNSIRRYEKRCPNWTPFCLCKVFLLMYFLNEVFNIRNTTLINQISIIRFTFRDLIIDRLKHHLLHFLRIFSLTKDPT